MPLATGNGGLWVSVSVSDPQSNHVLTGFQESPCLKNHVESGRLSQSTVSFSEQDPRNGKALGCHRNPIYAPQSLLLTCSLDSLSGDADNRQLHVNYGPYRPDVLEIGGLQKAPLAIAEDLSPCPNAKKTLSDVQSLVCDRRSLLSHEVVPDGCGGKSSLVPVDKRSWNENICSTANGTQPVVVLYRPRTSQYGNVMTSLSAIMTSTRPPQIVTRTRHTRESRLAGCANGRSSSTSDAGASAFQSGGAAEMLPFVSRTEGPSMIYGSAKRPPSFIRAVEHSDAAEAILKVEGNRPRPQLSGTLSTTDADEELQKILEIAV